MIEQDNGYYSTIAQLEDYVTKKIQQLQWQRLYTKHRSRKKRQYVVSWRTTKQNCLQGRRKTQTYVDRRV